MAESDWKRMRFSVPYDDVLVLKWCAAQHNLSMSLRQLARQAALTQGLEDVFATTGDMSEGARSLFTEMTTRPNAEVVVAQPEEKVVPPPPPEPEPVKVVPDPPKVERVVAATPPDTPRRGIVMGMDALVTGSAKIATEDKAEKTEEVAQKQPETKAKSKLDIQAMLDA